MDTNSSIHTSSLSFQKMSHLTLMKQCWKHNRAEHENSSEWLSDVLLLFSQVNWWNNPESSDDSHRTTERDSNFTYNNMDICLKIEIHLYIPIPYRTLLCPQLLCNDMVNSEAINTKRLFIICHGLRVSMVVKLMQVSQPRIEQIKAIKG